MPSRSYDASDASRFAESYAKDCEGVQTLSLPAKRLLNLCRAFLALSKANDKTKKRLAKNPR